MNQDFQTVSLRNQLLKICPEMQDDIQTVSKEDLKELLAMAIQGAQKNNEYDGKSNFSGKPSRRDHMIQQLSRLSPDISQEQLKALSDADIEDIYIKYKQISDANKKKQLQKKQENKKRRIIENGEINIYEMKRVLIDKIPQYRNDIRNLTDDEIKRMYRQLQDKTQMSQKFMRPISPNPATYQSFIPPPTTFPPQPYPMSNSLPILSGMPTIPKLPLRRFDDQNENFFESQANQSQFGIRKRGRPRKIRQSSGFNYDDAPNYGGGNMQNILKSIAPKPFEYGGQYQPSDYSNLVPKYHQNQSNYPISYEQSGDYKGSKSGNQNFMNQFPESSIEYGRANEDQASKVNSKLEKRAKKCKITFYLDSSDLQDEQTQVKTNKKGEKSQTASGAEGIEKNNLQDNQQNMKMKSNRLTSLIQALQEAFGKQSWKIQ